MPQPIYIPQREDPFSSMLPQLLMQMVLGKMKSKWDLDETKAKLELLDKESDKANDAWGKEGSDQRVKIIGGKPYIYKDQQTIEANKRTALEQAEDIKAVSRITQHGGYPTPQEDEYGWSSAGGGDTKTPFSGQEYSYPPASGAPAGYQPFRKNTGEVDYRATPTPNKYVFGGTEYLGRPGENGTYILTPQGKEGKALKTWVNPKNPEDVVNLQPGVDPPKGYVPYSSPLVKIDMGKNIPAEQASQLGEFSAYEDTLSKIDKAIKEGKIDTGPFEFIKKRLDNWGILPKEERIQLRTWVARLPGLMYAMRGKQLSDKELEVALEMMPKMSSDEKVFKIETNNFLDYMNKVLGGKKKALGEAGFNMKGFGNSSSTPERPSLDSFFMRK